MLTRRRRGSERGVEASPRRRCAIAVSRGSGVRSRARAAVKSRRRSEAVNESCGVSVVRGQPVATPRVQWATPRVQSAASAASRSAAMSVVDAYRRIIGAPPATQRAGPRRPTPVRQRWPTVTMGRHVCAGGPGSGGVSLASKIGACCPAQCGRCGGAGCDKFPGGLEACCPGELVKANKSCDDFEPPCMVPKYRSAFVQSRTKRWNDSSSSSTI